MDTSFEIPIGAVIISIFIGYMYHYLKSDDYKDVISLKSLIIGTISGFLISLVVILVSLINANSLDLASFLTSIILIIYSIFISISLVVVGGVLAVAIKNIIHKKLN